MSKAKAKKTDAPDAEPEPIVLPGKGTILIYRASEGEEWPMIVTSVGDTSFSGQTFMDGTQRGAVENVTLGDGIGQCAPPDSNPSKEA